MKLFKFELLKSWRQHRFIVLLLLMIGFTAGAYFLNNMLEVTALKDAEKQLTAHYQQVNAITASTGTALAENPDDELLKAQYENAQKMNSFIADLLRAYSNHEKEQIPMLEQEWLKTIMIHIELGGEYPLFDQRTLSEKMERNEVLLKHGLAYEGAYSTTMPNFMKSAAALFMTVGGLLLIVFLIGDPLIDEYENNTIKTLHTQPLKRWYILVVKYGVIMLSLLFVVTVFFLLSAILPLLFGGNKGSFSYPQTVVFKEGYQLLTTGDYLLRRAILFIGATSFVASLMMVFSILFSNRFSVFLYTTLLVGGGYVATGLFDGLQTMANPFYYLHFNILLERPETNWSIAYVLTLGIYSALLLLATYFLQERALTFRKEATMKRPFHRGNTLRLGGPLWAFIVFEWRKLWRSPFIKQVLIILMLLLIVSYALISYSVVKEEKAFNEMVEEALDVSKKNTTFFKQRIQQEEITIERLQKKVKLTEEEEEQLKKAQLKVQSIKEMQLTSFEQDIEQYGSLSKAYAEKDWPSFYAFWIKKNKLETGEIQQNGIIYNVKRPTETGSLSGFTYRASIQEKELLMQRQLEPVFGVEFLNTRHDHFLTPVDQYEWNEQTRKVDNTGLFYLYQFFDSNVYLILLGLLLMMFGIGFSGEKGKKRTLHFLKTQPLSKVQLLLGKFSALLLFAMGIVLTLFFLIVAIGTLGNRFGDWNFPVLFYDTASAVEQHGYQGTSTTDGGFHFINMGDYLIEAVLMFFASLIFVLSLSFLFSRFFKNKTATLLAAVSTAIGGYFISMLEHMASTAQFSPFIYLNISKIINGEIAAILNNHAVNAWTGITILMVCSALLLFLNILRIPKGFKNTKVV